MTQETVAKSGNSAEADALKAIADVLENDNWSHDSDELARAVYEIARPHIEAAERERIAALLPHRVGSRIDQLIGWAKADKRRGYYAMAVENVDRMRNDVLEAVTVAVLGQDQP